MSELKNVIAPINTVLASVALAFSALAQTPYKPGDTGLVKGVTIQANYATNGWDTHGYHKKGASCNLYDGTKFKVIGTTPAGQVEISRKGVAGNWKAGACSFRINAYLAADKVAEAVKNQLDSPSSILGKKK